MCPSGGSLCSLPAAEGRTRASRQSEGQERRASQKDNVAPVRGTTSRQSEGHERRASFEGGGPSELPKVKNHKGLLKENDLLCFGTSRQSEGHERRASQTEKDTKCRASCHPTSLMELELFFIQELKQ